MSQWAGRKVRRLIDLTLATKGTVCHLCDEPGADSADHEPPRSVLLAAGVPDPDDLAFLWPSHRYPCNVRRQARPITPALRAELRRLRARHLERLAAAASLSPRFLRDAPRRKPAPFPSPSPNDQEKPAIRTDQDRT